MKHIEVNDIGRNNVKTPEKCFIFVSKSVVHFCNRIWTFFVFLFLQFKVTMFLNSVKCPKCKSIWTGDVCV